MDNIRKALEKLYIEYGNDEVVVALSQYLDNLIVEEQSKMK